MIEKKLAVKEIVLNALKEDIGAGDLTTESLSIADKEFFAEVVAKEDLIVAGIPIAKMAFSEVDPGLGCEILIEDGAAAKKGDAILVVKGRVNSILTSERVVLNFLMRLSGIATLTNRYVEAIKGTKSKVVDTRKTTPCLRILEKYAVRLGGGFNHRFGLDSGVLIKNNHIAAIGSLKEAVCRVRTNVPHTVKVEVEVRSLDDAKHAVEVGVDLILMDNMSLEEMAQVVDYCDWELLTEASGNVTLENIRHIAELGVNYISVGRITHSSGS
ncbi:MAG: carboxylating nicotinate-nucleotide diphosphorylase, partial [Deltaproteobacteria bacterium]|nr:carboxylating nicotinate-nucleotide diphosphorylase [Deltaproteobacteria bacterium]